MAKKKKHKPHGHYCRICGEIKSNEKFSGKGHTAHICKACHALPVERRNELENINKINRIQENFFISKENLKRLKKYASDKRYPESSKYAQDALADFYRRMDEYNGNVASDGIYDYVLFSELDDDLKLEAVGLMEDYIAEFIGYAEYQPEKEEIDEILKNVCDDMSDNLDIYTVPEYDPVELYSFSFNPDMSFDERIRAIEESIDEDDDLDDDDGEEPPRLSKKLIANDELRTVYNTALAKVIKEFQEDGFETPTFMETLTVAETDRLIIREFIPADHKALFPIMKKPEVMYAWEHGFTKSEVKTWIGKQLKRYHNDGYGYFAVILKETGKLIGQAGLLKSEIDGSEVVEIGYIFDDNYWGNGYATEVAKACVSLGFDKLGLNKLCCTIRLENDASIKLAKRLGFTETGHYTKIYMGQEMPHTIFTREN